MQGTGKLIVQIQGGLGNQLFQYANGVELSRRLKKELMLDLTQLERNKSTSGVTPREFELEKVGIKTTIAKRFETDPFQEDKRPWLDILLTRWLGASVKLSVITERNRSLQCLAGGFKRDIFVLGDFQSPKFFSKVSSEVVQQIRESIALQAIPGELQDLFLTKVCVGVHVRRGDYLRNGGQNPQGVLDIDYYKRSARMIANLVPGLTFLIFSDDPDWCQKNLKLAEKQIVVNENFSGPDGLGHFRLMTQCKHFIIANSTFSWWAAWIGASQDSIVVAPRKWNKRATPLLGTKRIPRAWHVW